MEVRYFRHYSKSLDREMEYKTYGESGRPVLVFPSQNGRFYDYEDFDMIATLASFIESGRIRVICLDSIDGETWSKEDGGCRDRIEQHERWYHYICDELIPAVRRGQETFISTGCSMGGFHAANFFFRRPEFFDTLLAQSGLYHASYFFHGYSDDLVYLNSPEDYLTWMPLDHPYWDEYRRRRIIVSVGQGLWEDDLLASTRRLDAILSEKQVPHWFDYWGYDSNHDWPWWRNQVYYFMDKIING